MRRLLFASSTLVVPVLFALGQTAQGASPPTPWDGTNPFHCVIQNAGFGPTGPDPGADPYCVRFNKTHQNVSQLGVVDFLLKEPARTAAAVPKCFYFQEDHWRGSLVQSNGKTVIYEFQGHYFFNKATGDGGAWVTGFTVAGRTFDPTELPGFPPGYGRYFGPGTGGAITHNSIHVDPACEAKAQKNPGAVYAAPGQSPHCVPAAGVVDRHGVGPLTLGSRERAVRARVGAPKRVKRGFLHYCVEKGGALLVGQPEDRSGTLGSGGNARTVMLLTSSRGFGLRGRHGATIRVGSRARALKGARKLGRRHGLTFLRRGNVLAAVRNGHITFLGAYATRSIRSRRALIGYLARGT